MLNWINSHRNVILRAVIIYFTLSIVATAILYKNQYDVELTQLNSATSRASNSQQAALSVKNDLLADLIDDTLFLRDNYIDALDGDISSEQFERIMYLLSKNNANYDQVRLLDKSGNEVIRVNRHGDGNGVYLVKDADLQYKGDRYYFTEAARLDDGEVYLSRIDPNRDNGEIEIPLKPMIRTSSPVYENNELVGVLIINYDSSKMLALITSLIQDSPGSTNLINSEGYWIVNQNDSSKEWGFIYDDKKYETLARESPEIWNQVSTTDSGTIYGKDKVITYSSSDTGQESETEIAMKSQGVVFGEGAWYMLTNITGDDLPDLTLPSDSTKTITNVWHQNISIYLLLVALTGALTYAWHNFSYRQGRLRVDSLTGAFTRSAGEIMLLHEYRESKELSKTFTLLFLDLNYLKRANDNFGHESGDELLRSAVHGIKDSIRDKDFVIRYGGDEFVVVLSGADRTAAKRVWERIQNHYDEINKLGKLSVELSVAHGSASYDPDKKPSLEEMIKQADEEMYLNKMQIKDRRKKS